MTEWWSKYQGHVACAGLPFPEESWLKIDSQSGFRLHTYRFHHPESKAIICIFHGLFCESTMATHVAQKFFSNGFTVIAFDQEGHGKSEGPRGTIPGFQQFAKDSENFLLAAQNFYPKGIKIFILGHSMGGALCVLLSAMRPDLISGMILYSPALGVNPNFEPFIRKVVRCLNYCCCSAMKLKDVDQNESSRNKHYNEYFLENPGNYNGKLNVRTAVIILDDLEFVQSQLQLITTKVLLFQGGHDFIVSKEMARQFIIDCQSTDKEYVFYEDMYHEVLHEPEASEVISKSIDWVNQRI